MSKDFELTDAVMIQRMKEGWKGGLAEGTPCGSGSTIAQTLGIRTHLPDIIKNYNIKKINDAGCGDMHWIKSIDMCGADYKGYDLVPRVPNVEQLDITREMMRESDLIICRDVFIHLTIDRIEAALENFKQTGRYLLTASYTQNENDSISPDRNFSRVSLMDAPFNFPDPLFRINESGQGRWMGLWELSKI